MGLFTEASRRTMTAVTKTKVRLLAIKYDDILLLASENPKFSFYLMHLIPLLGWITAPFYSIVAAHLNTQELKDKIV